MLKAKLLVMAASPLFNGNPDYADFTNKDGEHLFSQEYSVQKWIDAQEACEEAIEMCEQERAVSARRSYCTKPIRTCCSVTG